MIDVAAVLQLHETTVRLWHHTAIENSYEGFLRAVCDQHQHNFLLWHEEDVARSPDAGDEEIAQVKRNIDGHNQRRNDAIERLDEMIIRDLAAAGVQPDAEARINTETPGSTIDRLSILSLRIYHMHEQAEREEADEEHRAKATGRLTILYEQRRDLAQSLAELCADLVAGAKRLKVYRQFKMYNDPTMNPYLYSSLKKAG